MMTPAVRKTVLSIVLAVLGAVVLVVLARPAHAAGLVDVKFVEPEKFSDAGPTVAEREATMKTLAAHLKELGRQLPDGQVLSIEVLDVDLAGELVWQRTRDVRVLRGRADVPRMHLRWTLAAGGRSLRSGDDQLSDLGYSLVPNTQLAADSNLPHEKRLLANWFRDRFGAAH